MSVNIPAERFPSVTLQENRYVFTRDWYRYFSQNNIENITPLQSQVTSLQATIAAQALQITELNNAISVIRDVAQINTLTSANEIPDLGRR